MYVHKTETQLPIIKTDRSTAKKIVLLKESGGKAQQGKPLHIARQIDKEMNIEVVIHRQMVIEMDK